MFLSANEHQSKSLSILHCVVLNLRHYSTFLTLKISLYKRKGSSIYTKWANNEVGQMCQSRIQGSVKTSWRYTAVHHLCLKEGMLQPKGLPYYKKDSRNDIHMYKYSTIFYWWKLWLFWKFMWCAGEDAPYTEWYSVTITAGTLTYTRIPVQYCTILWWSYFDDRLILNYKIQKPISTTLPIL